MTITIVKWNNERITFSNVRALEYINGALIISHYNKQNRIALSDIQSFTMSYL